MKRKPIDWDNLAPLGLGGRLTMKWIAVSLALSSLGSWVIYVSNLSEYQNQLYWARLNRRELRPGAVMVPFYTLLRHVFAGFELVALFMLPLSIAHYFYHYQDSRNIYLMRRLPNRWELWRRCLAIPLLAVLFSALMAAAHLLIFYAIYHLTTPEQCLQPGQWRMLWDSLFN